MFEIFQKGGIMMYPLILCSVFGLAITLERAFSLRRKVVINPEIVSLIENIKGPEDLGVAISICERHRGAFADIIRTGLENRDLPGDEMKESILDQGRQEVRILERGLVVLETVASAAPLLGLQGTVLGMIKVFTVISEQGVGGAASLSAPISEALITTATGLFIGIPALVMYNYFTHKAENLVLDIEKYSTTLLKKLKGFQPSELERISR